MSVTPQVGDNGIVLLNVRPTITRIKAPLREQWVKDPTPNLGEKSYIPEIQTREMESMLRLIDGEIAVMGGLMSDEMSNSTDAVPFLSKIPGIGTFFTQRNDAKTKHELVIFLKPTVIRDPSVAGDYRGFAGQLPNKDFFANNPGPQPPYIEIDREQAR